MKTKTAKNLKNSSKEEDLAIIKEIRNGDSNAFGKLYSKYKKHIAYNYFMKLNGDVNLVDDLVADLFTKVFERLDKYNENTASFSAWVTMVANNFLIDYIRVNGKNLHNHVSIEKGFIDNDSAVFGSGISEDTLGDEDTMGIEEKIILSEEKALILSIVNSAFTNRTMLEVVNLRYYQEKDYNEIVEITGLSLSSVKTTLFRAKGILAKVIKKGMA